jgi:NTP pyrophosphatase (non-canonical NTP hydrolase)
VDELRDALAAFREMHVRFAGVAGPLEVARSKAHVREELGDVFACVLQTAYRMGMTFDALDAEAERKVRLRFIGADAIDVTAEVSA